MLLLLLLGMTVALRAVTLDRDGEGVDNATLREIKLLSQLRHLHVIRLLEIVKDKNCDLAGNYTNPSGYHQRLLSLTARKCCTQYKV